MNIISQHIPGEVVTTSIIGRSGIYDWFHTHPLIGYSIVIIIGVAIIIKILTHTKDKEYQSYINGRMRRASKTR